MPEAAPNASELAEVPPLRRRKWISIFIAAFLLIQFVVPMTYYLRRDDPTTEAFAWRMFSSVHMSNWNCLIVETVEVDSQQIERSVPFELLVEDSTVASLRAGKLDIARKFLKTWVKRPNVVTVRYTAEGIAPSGARIRPVSLEINRGDVEARRVPIS